jgi:hypothetical protein
VAAGAVHGAAPTSISGGSSPLGVAGVCLNVRIEIRLANADSPAANPDGRELVPINPIAHRLLVDLEQRCDFCDREELV